MATAVGVRDPRHGAGVRQRASEPRIGAEAVLTAAVVVWSLGLAYRSRAFTLDDGAIVTRYVRNIVAGNGWVWNKGTHYNGITSAAYTLLVSLAATIVHGADTAQHAVSGLFSAVDGICARRLLLSTIEPDDRRRTRTGGRRAAAIAAAFLVPALPALTHTWGLETPTYLAVLLLGPQLRGRGLWVAVGLAPLVRPDGIVFSGVAALREIARTRKVPLAGAAICVLLLLPWAIFSWVYFGAALPSTIAVKAAQGQTATGGFSYAAGWHNELLRWCGGSDSLVYAVLLVALAGLADAVVRRQAALIELSAAILLQQAAFFLVKVPSYRWYYVPLLVLITVLCASAVGRVADAVSLPRLISVGLLLTCSVGLLASDFRQAPTRQDPREQSYAEIANVLTRLHATSVVCSEIGVLGADLPLSTRIVDISGLVTAPVLSAGPNQHLFWDHPSQYFVFHWFTGHGSGSPAATLIRAVAPELGPGTPFGSETPFILDARFAAHYRLVTIVHHPPYAALLVFRYLP